LGGAEFYPSCAQLKIGGSGTGKPSSDELVSFPGAYKDNDPGIFAPGVFDPGFHYQFPGPKVASFVANGGGSDNGTNSGSSSGSGGSSSTSNGPPTATNAPSSESTSKCKLKKVAKSSSNARRSQTSRRSSLADDLVTAGSSLNVKFYPKHLSRVMRNAVFRGKH
jgi:hypothetical protein